MREYVARLVKCGMPKDIATCIVRSFADGNDWMHLEEYVYSRECEAEYREANQL